jgi:hypothetical protein
MPPGHSGLFAGKDEATGTEASKNGESETKRSGQVTVEDKPRTVVLGSPRREMVALFQANS